MALPKKGIRKITVAGVKYGYKIKGNDLGISFSIDLLERNGQLLTGRFSYHPNRIPWFKKDGSLSGWALHQRIRVRPDTIRQIIEYALNNGWNPQEDKGQIRLEDIEKKIQLDLKPELIFPKLEDKQVSLHFAKLGTGVPLNTDLERYEGEGQVYQIFDSISEAKVYARKMVKENPSLEVLISKEKDTVLFYLSATEEKTF